MPLPIISLFNFIRNRIKKRNWGDVVLMLIVILGYGYYQKLITNDGEARINNLENKVYTLQTQVQQNSQNTIVQINSETVAENNNKGAVKGISIDNPIGDNWYKNGFILDKEGYFCSNVSNNNYWSLWSKASYPLTNNNIITRVEIKPQKTQTIYVMSMGQYDGINAPRPVFQLNLFEGDGKEIRIYGNNTGKSLGQRYLQNSPDFNKDIIVTTTTRSIDSLSGELLVSFSVDYFSDGKSISYKLDEPFKVETKYLKVEDGVRAQLGLGISKSGCFKVSSVEIKK